MAVFNKPDVNNIWASGGTSISPGSAKITQGWVKEIPDFEFENFVQNRQDQFNAHMNQHGIPVWDSTTEYQQDKSYVQGSNGIVYRAKTTNTAKNPTTSTADWVQAFDSFDTSYTKAEADAKFLIKANNLSDLGNVATARANLSVYSKAETDSKYPTKANNLSDLGDVATARTNLFVYSKTETDNKYAHKANNLSDLGNVATARSNLSVYSKAEVYTKTESDDRYANITGDTLTGFLTLHANPTANLHAVPKQYVDTVANPSGTVIMMATSTLPSGYLKCNGAAVSRTTYSALFNAIGTTFGGGDGSTTFNVPEMRGEFVRGWDDGRGVDTGRAFGSSQSGAIEAHTHTASTGSAGAHTHTMQSAGAHTHTFSRSNYQNDNGGPLSLGGDGTVTNFNTSSTGAHTHTINSAGSHTHTVTVNSTGGSETRPRNIALMYCIKT